VIVYAETSAVLQWLFAEDRGEAVRATLAEAQKVVSSRLTMIEARRVVRRAEREGRVTAAQAADVLAVLAQAASTWALLEISETVARRAEEGFPTEPVRTLDAIHLASALLLRQAFPDLMVMTTEERVRSNAALLGFATEPAAPPAGLS
jgi:predicted nucleic acid-binding protein